MNKTLFDQDKLNHLQLQELKYLGDWAKHIDFECKSMLDVIIQRLNIEYARSFTEIYPAKKDVFKIFRRLKLDDIKVVIIGQDPYYNGQANGYAFGSGINTVPDSLKHIRRSMPGEDTIFEPSLEYLVEQGVFLMNTIMTVEKGKPESHVNLGWLYFTRYVVNLIIRTNRPVVWLLWGNYAKSYANLIPEYQAVLTYSHPVSAEYNKTKWNCPHFEQANKMLVQPIIWK